MRERIRQTYTSLEIGLMQEENEQLKRRLEKAIEYIKQLHFYFDFEEDINKFSFDFLYMKQGRELLEILQGEEII